MAEDKNIFLDPNNPSLPQVNQAPVGVQTQSVQPQYAGYWVRIVAAYIDGAFFGILTAPFNFGLSKLLPQPDPVIVGNLIGNNSFAFAVVFLFKVWVPLLISGIITLAIAIYFITRYGGTPGKIFFEAKIVDGSGKNISVMRAVKREVLGKFISNLTFGIGYSMVAFSKQKRGLHDKIAGTYVVLNKPLSRWKKILVFIFAALPTIAILGILAAILLLTVNPAKRQNQAQDAARKSDVGQIVTALQAYHQVNNKYPARLDELISSGDLKTLPKDPQDGTYVYSTSRDMLSVTIYANLEAGQAGFSIWCWTSETGRASEVRSASECKP